MCLRQLEDVQYMDTTQKVQFYCSQLKNTLYLIPEVSLSISHIREVHFY